MDPGFEPLEEDQWSMLLHWAKSSPFQHALSRTESGDVCLRLAGNWTALLLELGKLGPLALLTCHDQCQVTQLSNSVDFQSVPGSTEVIDLNSGLSVDTGEWSFALGVEERRQSGSMLGFQFFDRAHRGVLKILMTSDSHLLSFRQLLRDHSCQRMYCQIPEPEEIDPSPESEAHEEWQTVRSMWKQLNPFHPDSGGWPSGHHVKKEETYAKLGMPYAKKVDSALLLSQVMDARSQERALEVIFYRTGLERKIMLTPQRLEKCPCGLHLIDSQVQILFPLQGYQLWSTNYPNSNSQCLEAFNPEGERLFALRAA